MTNIRNLFILIFCVACVAIVPLARAQWVCQIAEGQGILGQGYNSYWYTALSCKGNNAVVAAEVNGGGGFFLAFLVSTDGGRLWSVQGKGLPTTWNYTPMITSIDQIDSLNTIAFGDSDLLVRTTDGGATWLELTSPSKHLIAGISFSDPMHGMLLAADTAHGTYVTTNGGLDWSTITFTRSYGWQCHDYGNGMYRIFDVASAVVYTTSDDWNTVDSTGPIIADTSARQYTYVGCSFGESDTMFAYGYRIAPLGYYPFIARSVDGGKLWTSVYSDTSSPNGGEVYALSDITRDTIIAGIRGNVNCVLWSTNRGETWRYDTLILPDTGGYGAGENFGIGFNSEGELLGAYSLNGAFIPFILIGEHAADGIVSNDFASSAEQIFPNPARISVTLTGATAGRQVHLLDILGREVLSRRVPASGTLMLDISSLPPGLYYLSDGTTNTKFVKE